MLKMIEKTIDDSGCQFPIISLLFFFLFFFRLAFSGLALKHRLQNVANLSLDFYRRFHRVRQLQVEVVRLSTFVPEIIFVHFAIDGRRKFRGNWKAQKRRQFLADAELDLNTVTTIGSLWGTIVGGLGRLAARHLPCGPVGLPSGWAATSVLASIRRLTP